MVYNPERPSYHILISLIEIWNVEDEKNPLPMPDKGVVRFTEVSSVNIADSYKNLINTATVCFPRGTVIRKSLEPGDMEKEDSHVKVSLDDYGAVIESRGEARKAVTSDFSIGQRIRIRLGYTTDPKVAALARIDSEGRSIHNDNDKYNRYVSFLTTMFDGYITKISADEPIELACENMASRLKKIVCPNVRPKRSMTVNDYLSDKGTYHLLRDSGLELYPETEKCEINLGALILSSDLNVADLLAEWGKIKLYAYVKIENNKAYIAVQRTYFSTPGKDSITANRDREGEPPLIDFSYHVAANGLKLMNHDPNFLAVEAQSMDMKGKFTRFTIRLNPDGKDETDIRKKYQVLNETKLSRKQQKAGATKLTDVKGKVDLSRYDIIPYISRKIGISRDELFKEAVKYYESYHKNGVEGTLTIFGDLHLFSGTKVRLLDDRHPAKNGYYLIDDVSTVFGTGGYRQTIRLPYCIKRNKDDDRKS